MESSNINSNNSTSTALILKNSLSNRQTFLLYFYTYAFLGWVVETIYAFCLLGGFSKRGFLFGALCPIYGFGAIIMLLFISKYKDNSIKNFFASAIIFSVFEYLVGFTLEALLKIRLWDYTNDFFNINGRISMLYTLFWGIAGIIFINHIHPFIKKLLDKILNELQYRTQVSIITLFTILFVSDIILSCIKYVKLF